MWFQETSRVSYKEMVEAHMRYAASGHIKLQDQRQILENHICSWSLETVFALE